MDFSNQIKRIRTEHELTQEGMAKQLNVSRQTISSWENNRNLPDLEMVVTIAKTFDLSLDQLILGNDLMEKKLINDGSEVKKAKLNVISGLFFIIGALSFVLSSMGSTTVDEQGVLKEPLFFLIPLGYLFLLVGLVIAIISLIKIFNQNKTNP